MLADARSSNQPQGTAKIMLDFTVTVSEADFYAANARLFRSGWAPSKVLIGWLSCTILFSAVASVGINLASAVDDQNLPLALAVGAAIAAFFLAARFAACWLQLPGSSNKQYALIGTLALPTHYSLSADRFRARYSEGTSDHPWTRFCDYVDEGKVLMLRRTPGFLFIIPKHQLSEQQLDDLFALLAQVGVKRG